MNDLWTRSTLVAAFAFVVARTCSKVNPDEAMLTGMMHGIGKLYIMTRAAHHPGLFTDNETLDGILNDWHAAVGKAILENWDFAESMAQAVGEQDDHSRDEDVEPDLRDVVAIAILLASYSADSSGLDLALHGLPAKIRLGLDEKRTHEIMDQCADEVAALSSALGA